MPVTKGQSGDSVRRVREKAPVDYLGFSIAEPPESCWILTCQQASKARWGA
jgi:hypothetical protein